jgi:hypothetical protein
MLVVSIALQKFFSQKTGSRAFANGGESLLTSVSRWLGTALPLSRQTPALVTQRQAEPRRTYFLRGGIPPMKPKPPSVNSYTDNPDFLIFSMLFDNLSLRFFAFFTSVPPEKVSCSNHSVAGQCLVTRRQEEVSLAILKAVRRITGMTSSARCRR